MSTDLFGEEIIDRKLIDREILANIFLSSFRGISEQELVSMIYTKYEAIIDFSKLCKGEKTGEKISMLFNPHRYSIPTINSCSIIEAFNKPEFFSGLARATLFKEGKVKELLYQVLQLGINGVQYVNEFPPIVARDFYITYKGKKILDPCAGWGGRMIGAASVGAFYHGFEPSTKTYNGLIDLGNFLKLFKTGFDFKIENIPFEDAVISDTYDIALTSPPYYNTELYSNEETQSCNRYKTFTNWCVGFFIPMIEKTIENSELFIINIGSRRYDLKTVLLNNFYNVEEVKSRLSGGGGMGKKADGKESFYLIKGVDK